MAAAAVPRRALLAGATGAVVAASVGGLSSHAGAATVSAAGPGPAGAAKPWTHAAGVLRGSDVAVRAGRDKEGRFGVMFKNAEGFAPPDDLLKSLAAQMGEPAGLTPALDNPRVPAGFTFLGQFIDHDMTLDRTPVPEQEVDPLALTNFDTPLFDLGSLYGRGPDRDPALYEPGGSGRMRVVRNEHGVDDLPRQADGTALIGDHRNDENLIISQLHLLFAKFHNRCLDTGLARSLAEAQRLTRWHFQWVIVHDFLDRLVGADVVPRFLDGRGKVKREFYKPKNPHRPMMPIEYSVAAYRFGHSMVRAAYLMNARTTPPVIAPIFGAEDTDLRGSRPLPARLEIDWWHFFEVPGRAAGPRNQARRIDTKLSLPLFDLPPTVVSDAMTSLAERNLIRGKRLGLPAGQDVATRMGVTALTNTQLGLPDPANPGWSGKAPLWFYILRESELQTGGERLGTVGGRLVAEVILGILEADKASYLHAKPPFTPAAPIATTKGEFRMGDLIAFAQGLG
ncbi:peroxidase family protein [Paractinoplanes abujensis]|uniref:peroxidase family protein n=1 Tax=Paractinoplanes abujensis TaxID=882441 RepID=UPI00160B911B|nr:heme peroxidase family protein [Actinoplanes abujensis]